MLLRRDQGIIRCLLELLLAAEARGIDALHAWYDERMFPSQESELPVDKPMLSIGEDLFRMPQCTERSHDRVHSRGQRHRLPPSALDALFFAMD